MKTVFGDVLEDFLEIGNTIYPEKIRFDNDYHQLLRCKNHKTIEGGYVLKMPKNSAFLDIGANFGDTVLTMSIYAKNNNRPDIRFFAFEPNKIKCQFIEKVAERNNLKIKVYNYCVGNSDGFAISDGLKHEFKGSCSYKYNNNSNNGIKIMKIDSIQNILEPVGLMHVDTEGWEIEVLKGCHNILNNKKNCFILICEYWSDKIAKREKKRGRALNIMRETPRKDILMLVSKYNYEQLKDIIDDSNNLVFKINKNEH